MEKNLPTRLQNYQIFLLGAFGYGTLEILFRGFTHWTMLLSGGTCFLFLFYLYQKKSAPLWLFCLNGALIITAVEFFVGCIINLWLGWNIWSYSSHPGNILGQICPLFMMLWFFLCFPLVSLIRYLSFSTGRLTALQSADQS